jgi:hypothetical protein
MAIDPVSGHLVADINGCAEIAKIRITRFGNVEHRASLPIERAIPQKLVSPIIGQNHDIGLHPTLGQAAGVALILSGSDALAQGQWNAVLQLFERQGGLAHHGISSGSMSLFRKP